MKQKKYFTPEEKKQAQKEATKRWVLKNKDKVNETKLIWAQKQGFSSFTAYVQSQPSYKNRIKGNQSKKFKQSYSDKPEDCKQHPQFTDYYIDTEGGVWKYSLKKKAYIKISTQLNKSGYYTIQLYIGSKRYMKYHHRIVAEAYHGLCPTGMECDHINADKSDNRPSNLQYLTKLQNLAKRPKTNTKRKK